MHVHVWQQKVDNPGAASVIGQIVQDGEALVLLCCRFSESSAVHRGVIASCAAVLESVSWHLVVCETTGIVKSVEYHGKRVQKFTLYLLPSVDGFRALTICSSCSDCLIHWRSCPHEQPSHGLQAYIDIMYAHKNVPGTQHSILPHSTGSFRHFFNRICSYSLTLSTLRSNLCVLSELLFPSHARTWRGTVASCHRRRHLVSMSVRFVGL